MNSQTTSEVRVYSGQVQAVAQNEDARYGVKVDGAWFNGSGKAPVKRGQMVEITYTERDGYRSIKEIREAKVGLSETVPRGFGTSDRDVFVARCVAIKAASTLHAGSNAEESWQWLFKEAEAIAKWLLEQPKKGNIPSSPNNQEGDDMVVILPTFKGYTVDMRLREVQEIGLR